MQHLLLHQDTHAAACNSVGRALALLFMHVPAAASVCDDAFADDWLCGVIHSRHKLCTVSTNKTQQPIGWSINALNQHLFTIVSYDVALKTSHCMCCGYALYCCDSTVRNARTIFIKQPQIAVSILGCERDRGDGTCCCGTQTSTTANTTCSSIYTNTIAKVHLCDGGTSR